METQNLCFTADQKRDSVGFKIGYDQIISNLLNDNKMLFRIKIVAEKKNFRKYQETSVLESHDFYLNYTDKDFLEKLQIF